MLLLGMVMEKGKKKNKRRGGKRRRRREVERLILKQVGTAGRVAW